MRYDAAKTFESAVNSGKLIHCITNPVSINLLANGILALGCRPIMAEHPKEAAEITSSADSLLLNCGNITDARISSIEISAKTAAKNKIPMVFDTVGTSCSELRRKFAVKIIKKYHPQIVKGNASEIYALYCKTYRSSGIDSDASLKTDDVVNVSKALAEKYSCIILASGKTDIVTDGKQCAYIQNGTEKLSHITGTGCLLGALSAVMLTGGTPFSAAVAACGVINISAEFIPENVLSGNFGVKLIDEINAMTYDKLLKFFRLKIIK